MRRRVLIPFVMLILATIACDGLPGVPVTPTLIPVTSTSTPSETSIAPTDTPTTTATPTETFTPSATATFTPSQTPSDTPTGTLTPTSTPSITPTPSDTATATPTATLTPSNTYTPTFTPSAVPTETPTPTATNTEPPTFTPTATDTASVTPSVSPTFTDTPTPSSTPSPTVSPSATQQIALLPTITPPVASNTPQPTTTRTVTAPPVITATPGAPLFTVVPSRIPTRRPPTRPPIQATRGGGAGTAIPGVRPSPTAIPPIVVTAPNSSGGNVVNPFAPQATALAGTRLPTAAYRDRSGIVVPIFGGGPPIATIPPGNTGYAVNPQTGQVAVTDQGGNLSINSIPFTLSPMSTFGLGNFKVTGVRWSPDGRFLAFRVERPDARDGRFSFEDTIDDGIWIWDRIGNQTRQIFRNEYRQGAPNQQIAYDFRWANDSQTVIVYTSPDRREFRLVRQDTDLNR
jgi:hypothetical protein